MEKILKALANRRRLLILKFLKKRNEATVGEIAEGIALSFKATSKHLGILANVGIIDREQRGLQMNYSMVSNVPECARRVVALL